MVPDVFLNQMAQFVSYKKIAVAVSGGGDSFALLHLAHLWAQENNIALTALTVDHQLRTESADEAKAVAAWCAQHNITHETLRWNEEKPVTGIQAKARKVRRRLLCEFCLTQGINMLLLGHQADDQAETMIMRLQRGTGLKGLKAMQPITRDKATQVILARPLLSVRREDLRYYCLDHHLSFIDDPSNEKRDFERVRVRQALAALPDLGKGIALTSERLRRADHALQLLAQEWLEKHIVSAEQEQQWLPQIATTELLPEILLRVLALALPNLRLPQLEKLAQHLKKPDFSGVTMGDAWIRPKIINKQLGFLFQNAPLRRKTIG